MLGMLLRQLQRRWVQAIEAALAEAGFDDLRPLHSNVFPHVPPEGIQVSEMTRLARVRKQTMAQAVEELERLGYVERRPDPRDGRARLVFLTERGRSVRPVSMAASHRVLAHWEHLLGAESLSTLQRSLETLLERLRDAEGDAPNAPTGQPAP